MSLRLRLLAAFAYVVVLVLVALELPLALTVSDRADAELEAQAAAQAHLIAASASGRLGDSAALDRVVERAARDLSGRIVVVGAGGRLLADSAGDRPGADYGGRPEIAAVLAGGRTEQGRRYSGTLDQNLLYTAVPVVSRGQRVGAVRVTQSVEALERRVRRDVLVLLGLGGIALVLGLVLAWLLAGSLARPLHALAHAARRVGRGELEARAAVTGSTEQREVAQAFNDMAERLGQVLVAQREFVANASHQLRTPLTGLRLRLEAASLHAEDAELRRDLSAAEHETERLAKLLGDLLTLAREGERPSGRAVSLRGALESAFGRWAAPAERVGKQLELTCGGEVEALASPDDVSVILDNLVENALAYGAAGTTVTLACGAHGDAVFLAVLDEGPGFGPGEEQRLFGRFVRGSSTAGTPGTGLGLAIVEALARRWGGTAALSNREHGGARVEVRLPLARSATPERVWEAV